MAFKPDSYFISNPVEGLCKSYGAWGMSDNVCTPLIYFRRPKWIKDDECWDKIVKSVRINLPEGFEIS